MIDLRKNKTEEPVIKQETNEKSVLVVVCSLGLTLFVLLFAIAFAFTGCSEQPEFKQQVFKYELEPNTNGVTMFTINSDSSVTCEYVMEGKTIRLDSISGEVYEDTMRKVYKQ